MFALLDPDPDPNTDPNTDPDPQTRLNTDPIRIRIRFPNADTDPADQNQCGSGTTTLLPGPILKRRSSMNKLKY
jgi:hypothetical protein